MNAKLLDKEVLCIYDIRAIQAYIFSNNNNIDIIGAGEFVKDIHLESLKYAFEHSPSRLSKDEYCLDEWGDPNNIPYLYDPKVKAQLITIGGGNAFVLFRSGALAEEINKVYARYVLESSYSLQVAVAATERTNDFSKDINLLYDELQRVKNTQPFFHPLGALPIVEKEEFTGNPVHMTDEETGEHISLETKRKRERARLSIGDNIRGNISKISDHHKRLAYIHIDGNGFGLAIGKIFEKITDYEEGIKARRRLNANIMLQYLASLDETEEKLYELMASEGIPKDRYICYYQRINIGGDDINVVCAPKYAFRFVSIFVDIVTKKYIWNDDSVGAVPFSVCAGVAFVHSNVAFSEGYELAEQCCAEAKKEAKKPCNSINGAVGNWLDYQIVDDRRLEDISTLRERDFRSGDFQLCLRPYCLDKERQGTFTHVDHLRELFDAFEKYLPATLKWRLLDSISESPTNSHFVLEHIMFEMREEERNLLQKKLLPLIGSDTVEVEGRKGTFAHWYDALELSSMSDWEKIQNTASIDLG